MKINIDQTRCPKNHRCPSVSICPVDAILQKGFDCPTIDEEKCIRCGKCITYCPMKVFSFANN